ncbi:MAG: hypothetical protein NTW95_11215 [Candidatus Aminicenantes bacterium]|nr:hypothetical protein [Candidatus Aminicenantes bacterium]
MKKIAVFIQNYNIDYSPSIINLLDFLSDRCAIDLFVRNAQMKNSPVLKKANVRLTEIRRPPHRGQALASTRQRLAGAIRGQWRNALRPVHGISAAARRFDGQDYHCHIVFDAPGLLLCKELFPMAKPFYYSLELALLTEASAAGALAADLAYLEKAQGWSRDIRGLIIQSQEREMLFRHDQRLGENVPALHLPVTGRGPAKAERLRQLHEQFAIPAHGGIAIHLGGANPYYSSLAIAEVFTKIEGWHLFFQGNHLRGYGEEIRALAKRSGARNIVVLKKFFSEIDALDRILMSASVGIAWYNDLNANFRSAGQSSGKITAYLKFGLPVIANRYPSTEAALATPGCGICVAGLDEIPAALERIAANYDEFSANARREYEKNYRFENYRQPILDFLDLAETGRPG